MGILTESRDREPVRTGFGEALAFAWPRKLDAVGLPYRIQGRATKEAIEAFVGKHVRSGATVCKPEDPRRTSEATLKAYGGHRYPGNNAPYRPTTTA